MNVGVVLPNWIGDVVMATPTLRAIQNHYGPSARIVGVMRPYVADVLQGLPYPDEVVLFDPLNRERSMHTWPVARRLRKMGVEVMVLLTNSLRSAMLANLSGARQRVGYVRNGRGWLLNVKLRAPRESGQWRPISAVDYYAQTANALGAIVQDPQPELATLPEDVAAAKQAWKTLGIPEGARVVLMNSGGAYGQAKHWPATYFSKLANRIAQEYGHWVVVLCGPAEREIAAQIQKGAGHSHVQTLAGFTPSIGLTKACVQASHAMITTDSGPRHFANAFHIPVITLFGPTDPRWSETRHPHATHLQEPVDCGPCSKRVCPLRHHRCMMDLTPEKVFHHYRLLLEQSRQHRAA